MKIFITLPLLFFTSCGMNYNSNTFDDVKYGPAPSFDPQTPAEERFVAAYNLLDSQCIQCHEGEHDAWAAWTTSEDWVNQGYVTEGDFSGSILISSLKNYSGNMPKGSSALTDEEIQILRDWIENL